MSDQTAYRGDYSLSAPNDARYSYVPFRGWQTIWTYKSRQAEIFALVDSFVASNSGASLDLTQDGPLWQLVVTFDYKNDGSSEVPVNTWELIGNDVQKDIYEHPTTLALGVATIAAVKSGINSVSQASPGSEQSAITDAKANIATVAGANASVANELFDLIVKGTTHYAVSEFVLRHTQSVSNTYTSQFALNNIEYIYTTAQLIAEAGIPSSVVFDINAITEPSARDGFLWGWLKRSPQIVFTAGAKLQMTQEYWLDQWSTYLYFTEL